MVPVVDKNTVFQRWHELLTDLTHITLSLHGFQARSYHLPIKTTDLIVSNGKTSDEQWGISQVSLAFRDSEFEVGLIEDGAMLVRIPCNVW